jgi:Fur family ferric uptake transcriptional regulator
MTDKSPVRMTPRRRVVLEELRSLKTHPTADELYRRVRERMPRTSLGTVYRSLRILAEDGRIRVFERGGLPRRFDGDVSGHYHIECVECGDVVDLPADRFGNIEKRVQDLCGYTVVGHRVGFTGVCPRCARKRRRRGTRV